MVFFSYKGLIITEVEAYTYVGGWIILGWILERLRIGTGGELL
jgi:hypothetical protein